MKSALPAAGLEQGQRNSVLRDGRPTGYGQHNTAGPPDTLAATGPAATLLGPGRLIGPDSLLMDGLGALEVLK